MILHIEDDKIISVNDIIGIFDLYELNKNKENRNFTFKFSDEEKKKKTVILVNKNGKTEEFFSDFSVATLENRINKNYMFDNIKQM